MKRFALKTPLASAITLVTAVTMQPAMAQDAMLEEVMVTAQKRQQSLQDVPVAVTAYDGHALEQAGVLDLTELQRSAPNTTLQTSRGTNSTLTAYIRGIGQADPLWGFEPGVGLYVDDVYFSRPQGSVLDVYDVERIEILRGPQGTLYGKNTIGGAIKYVTKRLSGEPELDIDATVGSYNQRDITVAGQMPLIENKLSVGASVARLQRDGFGEFLLSGDDNYNKDVLAARISLEYTPADDWFIRLAADQTTDDSNAKGGHRLTPSLLVPSEATPSSVYDSYADMDTNNEVESAGVALTVIWDINESYSLKSISAYREGETNTNIDFDNTSIASLHVPAFYDDDQLSQEFQLNFEGDNLHVIGGLYYYEGTATGAFDVLLGAFDESDLFGDGSNVVGNFDAVTAGSVDTTSYASYIHVTYDFSEQLSVTVGGRYTVDDKEAQVYKEKLYVDGNSSHLGGTDLFSLAVLTDYNNDDSWNEFSPRISVDYRIDDDLMVYGSFSQGFKSGGFDMRGDATENPATVNGYDPELVDTWELGMKSELWDQRLRLNAAMFYTDYTDLQVTVQSATSAGDNFVSAVVNAGEAEVSGFEVEAVAQLSENFSVLAAVGYIDAEFTEVITDSPTGPVDVSDTWEFAFTPDWTSHISFNYDYGLGDMGELALNLSASYRDDTRIFSQVASLVDEGSYTLIDANVVWYSNDEHWTVGLHGKNLSDKEYRVGGYNFYGLGQEDSVIGYYGNPRTVALNVGYSF